MNLAELEHLFSPRLDILKVNEVPTVLRIHLSYTETLRRMLESTQTTSYQEVRVSKQ